MCVCHGEPPDGKFKSAIWREEEEVLVKLSSRKNCQAGSGVMRRACCCVKSPRLCPVHVLWDSHLAALPAGTRPWMQVSPAKALGWLRAGLRSLSVSAGAVLVMGVMVLWRCQVPNAAAYGTHAFRRGMARVSACIFDVVGLVASAYYACRIFLKVERPWPRSSGLDNGRAQPSCVI